ncbi:hypothetical protein PoB_004030100 [Plakobranchus ocellatus]|uniref:Uncharacterized protein n=1 Tax=Plakobranchus ocellatus TaxID=259542 RepID=A0AAV4ARN6_9GAST|nr:hypothetical protein PoB_004030100 [Plakobranchus ocellatus]
MRLHDNYYLNTVPVAFCSLTNRRAEVFGLAAGTEVRCTNEWVKGRQSLRHSGKSLTFQDCLAHGKVDRKRQDLVGATAASRFGCSQEIDGFPEVRPQHRIATPRALVEPKRWISAIDIVVELAGNNACLHSH